MTTYVYASDKCEGTITRSREKQGKREESVIDFVVINSIVEPFLQKMHIDETKAIALSSHRKRGTCLSDHNIISCTFSIPVQKGFRERTERFDLRSEESLTTFKAVTTHTHTLQNALREKKMYARRVKRG